VMFGSTPPLDQLRRSYGMSALPDHLTTPAIDEFGHAITKPLTDATVDDIALAVVALNDEASALYLKVDALRRLHDRARRAGGLGSERAVEAALRIEEGGR
jgi:hypothetical protein